MVIFLFLSLKYYLNYFIFLSVIYTNLRKNIIIFLSEIKKLRKNIRD